MPKRLALALLDGNDPEICQWKREDIRALASRINGCMLTVTGTESWQKAMVTHGGVSLKDVDPRTLESKLVSGLYFAGEVLDLDGDTGGYNLQIAFSTGALAAQSAAASLTR
jgi:predicted flavoprotein YhiN